MDIPISNTPMPTYSPRFKPWAMGDAIDKPSHFQLEPFPQPIKYQVILFFELYIVTLRY